MRKKIDLDVTLTGNECGCGHGANEKADVVRRQSF